MGHLKPQSRPDFGAAVVKSRNIILILCLALLIPAVIGYLSMRVNYDMLTYLPDSMETMKGQNILMEDFDKGGFTLIVVEDMKPEDVDSMTQKIKKVEHVETVVDFDDIVDPSVPQELYPDELKEQLSSDDATMIAVFFDTSTSDEGSINAVTEIRKIVTKDCYVSGLTALVADLKNVAENEEPKYIVIAVILSVIAMMLMLDSYVVPFIFLTSIGFAILYNMGSNFMLGEIAYITKAIAAVLQLGVTMDYSIFLWNSYIENLKTEPDKKKAMAEAINNTLTSVTGSSVTTVAGFLALCFMTYRIGINLGIVMAKGCVIGVIASVTLLPSLILLFDRVLMKTRHKPLIPDMNKAAKLLTSHPAVIAAVFVLLILPAVYGYQHAAISYDFSAMFRGPNGIPEEKAPVLKANEKLEEDFGIGCTHMIITDSSMSQNDGHDMCKEVGDIDGVKNVLGIDALLDPSVPREMLPERITEALISENHQLILVNSEYKVSTDECNDQIDRINTVIHKYDKDASVIGEGPATKDLIELTGRDFNVVNLISIGAVFLIIFFVLRSWILPLLLVAVIEFAIYVNLGIPGYTGLVLPFIVPVCISTIQLGSTVDYAILMSTRYKTERMAGKDKRNAIEIAVATSIPSIKVSTPIPTIKINSPTPTETPHICTSFEQISKTVTVPMQIVDVDKGPYDEEILTDFDKVIVKTTSGLRNIENSGGVKYEA